jgi:ribosomal protein L3
MAGHYGHERVTTQNLKVVAADDEKGLRKAADAAAPAAEAPAASAPEASGPAA